jgi:NitT/TauT family transport system substrate-binding protein
MKLVITLLILILSACQTTQPVVTPTSFNVMSPKGAPALALVPLLLDAQDKIEFVDGTDVISAEFVKGELDILIAPINLGAQLTSKQDNPYVLYGVLTWGNLYVVANINQEASTKMAIFGQQAIPGRVLSTIESQFKESYTFDPFNSVAEVSAQLLAEQYSLGLLAEPSLSASLLRAKSSGITLEIRYDIQALWKQQTGFDNYPQAGVFVRRDLSAAEINGLGERFARMATYIESIHLDVEQLDQDTSDLNLEDLGLPNTTILKTAFSRMNVQPRLAKDVVNDIEAFLKLFNLHNQSDLYFHQVYP